MMDIDAKTNISQYNKNISKELRSKANDFLNSRRHANNLVDIIAYLQKCMDENLPTTAPILTLEVIFKELLKRNEMNVEINTSTTKADDTETQYHSWLLERYEEALDLILKNIEHEKAHEAAQAVVTCMKLLSTEGKYPLSKNNTYPFPKKRLQNILKKILSPHKQQTAIIYRFKEYAEYMDIVFYSWKLLHNLGNKTLFANETFALNYLEFINAIPVTKALQEDVKILCALKNLPIDNFYVLIKKWINRVWNSLMQWIDNIQESVHRQLLIVLLERFMVHLDKPVLLTDFLMDSLDYGGAVSLLALQGIFTLIQKHNITYPNIYEKLYSMFEPEIFHTKYKARLFYLADIFLSSTHLPESLVAAFAKRLARLSLIAPPQDAIIVMYFIGNLLLRHSGLKRLICAYSPAELSRDPYVMEEREPTKSNAIESSLWEIIALQKHAVPSVANTAKFISQPLPTTEWDLSTVLDIKEEDIFDQEIAKKSKQYALAFERPLALALPRNDKVVKYWKLF
ncbi:nucleolar complex protein 4 homolog A-like [Teleopsis dalmanni]|uniref:nucleolar complex protein 4 homolog A-like n=1 Tax=Teleopsis dalmanni TaxID=139649 RepID=UPI0018CF7683|nr:nucleolar complex protein 4 homolog A-like [Teleopsis dalmanni]XP_037939268.1 nucleolar complex protein 4 homolog A-like [Teleopsis dalmanni]